MSFDRIVEALLQEALERGEFDNLLGKGKPIDLTEYFETPEEIRSAYFLLKNAGMASREVDLLKEIAELKQVLEAILDEKKKQDLAKQIREKQIEFNLIPERRKRERRK